jgi:hypothetical protein
MPKVVDEILKNQFVEKIEQVRFLLHSELIDEKLVRLGSIKKLNDYYYS